MNFLKTSLLIAIVLGAGSGAMAGNCTPWTAQDGTTCIIAGQDGAFYQRQCENPCWAGVHGHGNWGPGCDMEQICSVQDPTTFSGPCSDWLQDDNTTCYDPGTNAWQQRWERACTVGIRTSACSAETPNL